MRLILTSFSVTRFYHISNLKSGSVFGGQVIVANLSKEKYKTKDPLKVSKTSTTTKEDILNNLERLNELYKKGVLTEEEYKKEKAELLEEL